MMPNPPECHPAFATLIRQRAAFAAGLTAAILLIYFGFIALVAFAPGTLATPVTANITLGFVLGLAVILSAIALTGLYVLRANTVFDRLTRSITGGAP